MSESNLESEEIARRKKIREGNERRRVRERGERDRKEAKGEEIDGGDGGSEE